MLSLLCFAITPSALSALARSVIHQASRKRGHPSGLHGAAAPVAGASLLSGLRCLRCRRRLFGVGDVPSAALVSLLRGRQRGRPVASAGEAAAMLLPRGLSPAAASAANVAVAAVWSS